MGFLRTVSLFGMEGGVARKEWDYRCDKPGSVDGVFVIVIDRAKAS